MIKKFIDCANSNHISYHVPITRILGNLATSSDFIAEMMIKYDGIKSISNLLSNDKSNVRKEAAWTLSNIAAGTSSQVKYLIELNIYPKVFELIKEDCIEIKKECS